MAGWVPKAALLLGRELKHVLIIRPQIRSLSSDAATMIKSAGFNFLKIDYDFGHPPFGLHYGYDVPLGSDGLPEWVDWSLVPGAVCQAKDQARLGICFAVAPVVSLGSLNFLKLPGPVVSRSPVVLSLQQVIDCMPGLKIGAGGNSMDVLDYIIRNGGLVPEACYPYLGMQGECKSPEGPLFSCDAWRRVIPNSMYALKYAVAHQPVIIDIRMEDLMRVLFVENGLVSGYDLPITSYQGGVITGPSSSLTDHVMVCIGYGEVPTRVPHAGIRDGGVRIHGGKGGDIMESAGLR